MLNICLPGVSAHSSYCTRGNLSPHVNSTTSFDLIHTPAGKLHLCRVMEFQIPLSREDLLRCDGTHYVVSDSFSAGEIVSRLEGRPYTTHCTVHCMYLSMRILSDLL